MYLKRINSIALRDGCADVVADVVVGRAGGGRVEVGGRLGSRRSLKYLFSSRQPRRNSERGVQLGKRKQELRE
jgi:hypothetical protein